MADQSKTEQPTQRRLEKAREEGQFPSAKEFVGALQFMVFLALLGMGGAAWFARAQVSEQGKGNRQRVRYGSSRTPEIKPLAA